MDSTDNSKATSIETNQYIKKYTTKEAIDKFVHLLILGRYTEKDLSDALNYCLIRSTESFDSIDSIKKAIEELKKDSEAFKIFQDNTNKLLDAIQAINKEQNTEINKINEFLKTAVTLDTEQNITGTKTFNKIYVSDPTENKQAANAQYVMDYVREQLSSTIGDLSNLKTESKDLIVNAINEVLDALNEYKETINETTINQMIDTKLNPVILRVTTLESTVDYTKELVEANNQTVEDLNTKVDDNTSDIIDINARLEEAVFYSKINDTRKTIQLKNYDSISGVSTTGVGFNIAMVSKWDKVDLGSNQIPINLNGSETRPTYNDSKEIALMDDVNTKADASNVYNKSEIDTKLDLKANSNSVYNKEDSDTRFVSLTENQNIQGNKVIEGIWTYSGELSDPKQLATTEYSKNYAETYTNQKVGDLTSLKTEAKDAAVAAINELFDKIGSGSTGGPVDTYTKQEINSKLDLKADASNVYNKSEIDSKLTTKADADNVYNKSEIDHKFETFTPGSGGSGIDTGAVNNLIKQATDPINTNVNTLLNNQGNLESLSTQNKNDLVSAINEINNKQVSVNIPEPDNTSIKIVESKYTAVKADADTYGIILPDNDTIYFDSGKIKAKQTEIDATTIEKNNLGKLKVSDSIIKSISDLDLKVQNLEQNIGGSGSGTPTPVEIKKATSTAFGIVKPDNNTIVIQDGVLSANIVQEKASNDNFGIVTSDKKTINISNGIISVVDHTTKLSQLKDINSLSTAQNGMVLTKTESGFEFKKIGEAANNRKTFTVNNADFAKVYDFNQHYNVALYAIVKLRASGEEPFEVKYTSSLGDSFTEQINTYKARQLTAEDLDCVLYIKGKCTAVIDIFSRY